MSQALFAPRVGFTDIMKRTGYYPYRPAFPYVEGYEVVGDVDAIGEGVAGFALGQRVCALTVYGAWAEYFTRDAEDFVPGPEGLDDAEVSQVRSISTISSGKASTSPPQLTPSRSLQIFCSPSSCSGTATRRNGA